MRAIALEVVGDIRYVEVSAVSRATAFLDLVSAEMDLAGDIPTGKSALFFIAHFADVRMLFLKWVFFVLLCLVFKVRVSKVYDFWD